VKQVLINTSMELTFKSEKCSVKECNKDVDRKGMCRSHYLRQWRHGSTDAFRHATLSVTVSGVEMRLCSRCKIIKQLTEFNKKKNGHSSWCKPCRKYQTQDQEKKAASTKAWRDRNIEYAKKKGRDYYKFLKAELVSEWLSEYGGKCQCCGENNPLFLTVEHLNGDGQKHRKEVGTGVNLLIDLKKNGWPKDKYTILCFNCNSGKARNGGTCPHKN
jgi:thiol-disulfide isomerase/thioredoxin